MYIDSLAKMVLLAESKSHIFIPDRLEIAFQPYQKSLIHLL